MKGEPIRPAGRDQARRADRRLPADRLRGQGGAAARGLPPPRRGHHAGRGRRHPRRVGGPLRPAARAGRGAARRSATCAPSATASGSPTSRSRRRTRHRLAPLELKLSETMRLRRLASDADLQGGRRASSSCRSRGQRAGRFLVGFLDELIAAVRAALVGRLSVGAASRRSVAAVTLALAAATAVVAAVALTLVRRSPTADAATVGASQLTIDQFAERDRDARRPSTGVDATGDRHDRRRSPG